MRIRLQVAITVILLVFQASVIFGQETFSWILNNNGVWNSISNWNDSNVPASNGVPTDVDTARFDAIVAAGGPISSITVTTAANQVNAVQFQSISTDYTIGGTGLSLTGGAGSTITKSGDKNATFSTGVSLLGNVGITNTNAIGSITFSNVIGGANQFNVTGSTGSVVVNAATNTTFNLGSGNNSLSSISGSTINLNGGTNAVNSASNTTININGGTNTIGTITGGSVTNTLSGATISGPTVFTGGSTHSIAGNNIGTLNVAGDLTYTNSTFSWQLGANSEAIIDFDQVIASGVNRSVSGSGSTLSLSFLPAVNFADSFWTSDRSWQIFSGFTTFTNPFSTITGGGAAPGTFSFSGGTLNFITAVPEPSSVCLVGLALLSGCVARRRKC